MFRFEQQGLPALLRRIAPEDQIEPTGNGSTSPEATNALSLTVQSYAYVEGAPSPSDDRDAIQAGEGTSDVDVKLGGAQIEYPDEDHAIHELFEGEVRNNGAICHMRSMIPWCTGE